VDEYGHIYDYKSQEYLSQIKELDIQIKKILKVVDEIGWIKDSTIIMTTDHGGIEKNTVETANRKLAYFWQLVILELS